MLCPELVRTRISERARNRPERYRPVQPPDPASPAGRLAARLAVFSRSGLDPSHVVARVVAAIRNEKLYVFTHPHMRGETKPRFATILAAMDKV